MEERKTFIEKYAEERENNSLKSFLYANRFNILRWIIAFPSAILVFLITPRIFLMLNSFPGYPSIIPKSFNLLWEQLVIAFIAPFFSIYTAGFIIPKYKYAVSIIMATLVITFYVILSLYFFLYVKLDFLKILVELISVVISICASIVACKKFSSI